MMKKWWMVAALLIVSTKLSAETVENKLGDTYASFVAMTKESSVQGVLTPGQQMFLTSLGKTVKKNIGDVSKEQLEGVVFKLDDFANVVGEALKRLNRAQAATAVDSSVGALKSQIEMLVGPKQAPQASVVTTNKSGQPVLHVQGVSGQTDADTLGIEGLTDEELQALYGGDMEGLPYAYLPSRDTELEEARGKVSEESFGEEISPELIKDKGNILESIDLDLPMHPSLLPQKRYNPMMLPEFEDNGPQISIVDTALEERINHLMATDVALFEEARKLAQVHRAKEEDLDTLLAQLTEAQAARLLSDIEDEELFARLTEAQAGELLQWIDQGMPTRRSVVVEDLKTLNRIAADAAAVEAFFAPRQEAIRARIESRWDDLGRILTRDEIRQEMLAQLGKHQLNEAEYALAVDAFVNAFATLQDVMWDELTPVYEAQPSPSGKRKHTNKVAGRKVKRLKMEEELDAATVLRRAEEALAQSRAQIRENVALPLSASEFDLDSLVAALQEAEQNEAKQAARAQQYREFLTKLNGLAFSDAETLRTFFELYRDNLQSKIEGLYGRHKKNLTPAEFKRHLLSDLKKLALSEQTFETAVNLLAQHLVDLQNEMVEGKFPVRDAVTGVVVGGMTPEQQALLAEFATAQFLQTAMDAENDFGAYQEAVAAAAKKEAAIKKYFTDNPLSTYGRTNNYGAKMRPILGGRELSQGSGTVASATMEEVD